MKNIAYFQIKHELELRFFSNRLIRLKIFLINVITEKLKANHLFLLIPTSVVYFET